MTQIISSPFDKTNGVEKCRQVRLSTILGFTETGRRVSIRCPFHPDKTASLSIYPTNGYHCFGCAKHGKNAVDFIVDLGYTFPEALTELKKYI